VIQLFLSDETIDKFHSGVKKNPSQDKTKVVHYKVEILYEDENLIAAEKPVGMLSQKAKEDDYSINEYLIDYLLKEKKITVQSMETFRPSVVNRLDRNTSGIILFGKSLQGSRELSEMIRTRKVDKFYLTAVNGSFPMKKKDAAYLSKDTKQNLVDVISEEAFHRLTLDKRKDYSKIETEYRKLYEKDGMSLLEVKLITGKSHQIRAHLKYLGFSVIGDTKYKADDSNSKINIGKINNGKKENPGSAKVPGIRSQVLHAYRVRFGEDASLGLAGKEIRTEIPGTLRKLFPDYRFER